MPFTTTLFTDQGDLWSKISTLLKCFPMQAKIDWKDIKSQPDFSKAIFDKCKLLGALEK